MSAGKVEKLLSRRMEESECNINQLRHAETIDDVLATQPAIAVLVVITESQIQH